MVEVTSQQPEELDFDTLALLPGGVSNYVTLIMDVLRYIDSLDAPSIIDIESALSKGRSIATRSLENYVQLLQRMGLFVRYHDSRVILKPLAHRLLSAQTTTDQARLLAELMLYRCTAMADVLVLFGTSARPLSLKDVKDALSARFPTWGGPTSFKQRILWWQALDCLVKHDAHRYVLTNAGKELLRAHGSQLESLMVTAINEPVDDSELDATASVDIVEDLIDELQAASFDSEQPHRFETALAAALSFLKDWCVDPKGRPGRPEEDVLATSRVPTSPLKLVFDAKARATGKLTDMNVLNLVEYRNEANANGAVVVAADFADGKMVRQATDQKVALLTVDLFSDLIRLYATTPLVLSDYMDIFITAGIVDALPERVVAAAERQQRWAELIAQIIFSLEDSFEHGWDDPVSPAQIATFLFSRLKDRRFDRAAIQQTVELLCNPVLGCLQRDENGAVLLRMNHATFIRRLRSLTDRIEMVYEALSRGDAAPSANEG